MEFPLFTTADSMFKVEFSEFSDIAFVYDVVSKIEKKKLCFKRITKVISSHCRFYLTYLRVYPG